MTKLPHPQDVQVLSGHPEVDAYRRAYSQLMHLRYLYRLNAGTLLRTILLYLGDGPSGDESRERACRNYREVAVPLAELERTLADLRATAEATAPEATERARLSILAKLDTLEAERVADHERRQRRRAAR